jgi:hypothetical protein
MLSARCWSIALVVVVLLCGCSHGSSQIAPTATAPVNSASTSDPAATKTLLSFGASTQAGLTASFAAVQAQVRKNPSELRDAAIPLANAPDPAVRFAAIYALSLTADDVKSRDALAPILESGDVSERLLAAEALLRGGDTSALPVVIDALGNDHSMELWEPPMAVWRFARLLLLGATGLDLGLQSAETLDQALVAKAAWEQWWRASGSTYHLPAAGPSS